MKILLLASFFILFGASAQSTYSSANQDSNPTIEDFDKNKDNTSGYIKQEQEFNENGEPYESFDSDAYKKDQDYLDSKKNSFNDL